MIDNPDNINHNHLEEIRKQYLLLLHILQIASSQLRSSPTDEKIRQVFNSIIEEISQFEDKNESVLDLIGQMPKQLEFTIDDAEKYVLLTEDATKGYNERLEKI